MPNNAVQAGMNSPLGPGMPFVGGQKHSHRRAAVYETYEKEDGTGLCG
jgi:hypothetical protein